MLSVPHPIQCHVPRARSFRRLCSRKLRTLRISSETSCIMHSCPHVLNATKLPHHQTSRRHVLSWSSGLQAAELFDQFVAPFIELSAVWRTSTIDTVVYSAASLLMFAEMQRFSLLSSVAPLSVYTVRSYVLCLLTRFWCNGYHLDQRFSARQQRGYNFARRHDAFLCRFHEMMLSSPLTLLGRY